MERRVRTKTQSAPKVGIWEGYDAEKASRALRNLSGLWDSSEADRIKDYVRDGRREGDRR